MRSARMVLEVQGLRVAEVSCGGGSTGWSAEEPIAGLAVVLVRSGLFRRRVDGAEFLADPMKAYLQRPGSVQQIAHPCEGDTCTVIEPSTAVLGELDHESLLDEALIIPAALDVHHRTLLARARDGADAFELLERTTVLARQLLARLSAESSRLRWLPNGARARSLTDHAQQVLAEQTDLGLVELAGVVGVSPFHLSHTFRHVAGMTLTRYRRQLRVKRALDRLAAGHSDLARLAADLGFADQAHFTRAVRAEAGTTPGQLRALLAPRDGRLPRWSPL